MSEDQQKKPVPPTPSTTSTPQPSPPRASQPVKGPLVSRRAFLIGAAGASVALTAAAFMPSGSFLNPLIPNPETENGIPQFTITDWASLDKNYKDQLAALPGQPLDPLAVQHPQLKPFATFFYWPYGSSTSPYYKDVVVRLPDTNPDGSPLALTPDSSVFTAPNGARFAAFNVTCVHLRCLVNPGYVNEYRLLCPCHGSQYRLVDGVPVAGPAYDLGLNPLPQVKLSLDPTNTKLVAVVWAKNPDGTPMFLNGVPGVGRG